MDGYEAKELKENLEEFSDKCMKWLNEKIDPDTYYGYGGQDFKKVCDSNKRTAVKNNQGVLPDHLECIYAFFQKNGSAPRVALAMREGDLKWVQYVGEYRRLRKEIEEEHGL
ncbi:MAG: hypothetical protein Tsb0018_00600 [Opitutales bacterium]